MEKNLKNDYKLLKFAKDNLFFFREENIDTILKLLTLTGFKEDLLINLNYLRGTEKSRELDNTERLTILNLNNEELGDKEYFQKLLKTGIINEKELFYLMLIHEQRHYFNLSDEMKKELQTEIKKMSLPFNEPDLSDIDSIAIFGSTYQTQKDRLINGLNYYRNKKGVDPTNIYLLTGYRIMNIGEFIQLGIISKEDLEGIKDLYERECGEKLDVLNPEPLINFIKNKEELLSKFNDEKIQETLQKFGMYDEKKTKIELLTKVSKLTEKDFFDLAVTELRQQNFIKNEQQIHIVYSNEMNGTNILSNSHFNQQSTTKRANTEDTLKALWEINSNFDKMLFVSNGPFVSQQFVSTLSIQDNQNNQDNQDIKAPKIYGENATHGTPSHIAARHYGMIPMVEKLFKQRENKIQNLLSSENTKQLKEIKNEKEAYEFGEFMAQQNDTYLGR